MEELSFWSGSRLFSESIDSPFKDEKVNGYSSASIFLASSSSSAGPQTIFVELQPAARKVSREG
jgi:hypothetical protein